MNNSLERSQFEIIVIFSSLIYVIYGAHLLYSRKRLYNLCEDFVSLSAENNVPF